MILWQMIRNLEGQTLKTLDRKRPFDIITVDDTQIIVRPHIRNLPRPIKREAFEGAWRHESTLRPQPTAAPRLIGVRPRLQIRWLNP